MIYEYFTRELPNLSGWMRLSDSEMEPQGWARLWADVSEKSCFVVYRRQKQVAEDTEYRRAITRRSRPVRTT